MRLRVLTGLARPLGLLVLAAGSAIITGSSLVYFDANELAPFVLEKLPLPHEALWLGALQVHVVSAALGLPLCLALTTRWLLRAPRVHRWVGRVTGVVVLGGLVPSGTYLSLFATAGWPSTIGFLLSGAIVVFAMVQGIRVARARALRAHRRWALHVLAQMSVAVTSRAMLFVFGSTDVDADFAYVISLWVPVLGSLVAVELFTHFPALTRRTTHETVAAPHAVHRHAVARHSA